MKNKNIIIKYLILVVAILFIGYGIFHGEIKEVYRKAIDICFSCIGIG